MDGIEDRPTGSKAELTVEDDSTTRKTSSRVVLVFAVIFAAGTVVLLITTVVFVVQKNDLSAQLATMETVTDAPVTPETPNVCFTEECIHSASEVLKNMNRDQNPCENFFEYACGGWNKRHVIPEGASSTSVIQNVINNVNYDLKGLFESDPQAGEPAVFNQVRNYYNACVHIDVINSLGAQPLTDLLDSLGGWPVLGDNPGGKWNPDTFEFEKLLAEIRGKYGVDAIIGTGVTADSSNSKYELKIDSPSFSPTQFGYKKKENSLRMRQFFPFIEEPESEPENFGQDLLLDEKLAQERQAYEQYMLDFLVSLGANETQAMDDISKVMEFASTMANFSLQPKEMKNTTLGGLVQDYPEVNWEKIYSLLVPQSVNPPVTDAEPIISYHPLYIRNVTRWLKDQDNRVIANFMIWRLVSEVIPFLGDQYQQSRRTFLKAVQAESAFEEQWVKCVIFADFYLLNAAGRMYVDTFFPEDVKEKTLKMIGYLQTAFKSMLSTNDWLQDGDKGAAAEKVDAMKVEIGYPDWIKDDAKLEEKFAGLDLKPDEYFNNHLSYMNWKAQGELARLRQNVPTKSMWDYKGPTTVNAFYFDDMNGFLFPAGILQPPYYNPHLPWYSIFGGIGVVIGHEITHGFDSNGRLNDKDGNERDWWSQASVNNFLERAQCIIDQYSTFVMPENGKSVNGNRTEAENIADNGGLRESFKAYKDNFPNQPLLPGLNLTTDQTFFLSYSQISCEINTPQGADWELSGSHSPARYRVIWPLQNSEEFNAAYSWPAGSYMNPAEKCRIW